MPTSVPFLSLRASSYAYKSVLLVGFEGVLKGSSSDNEWSLWDVNYWDIEHAAVLGDNSGKFELLCKLLGLDKNLSLLVGKFF